MLHTITHSSLARAAETEPLMPACLPGCLSVGGVSAEIPRVYWSVRRHPFTLYCRLISTRRLGTMWHRVLTTDWSPTVDVELLYLLLWYLIARSFVWPPGEWIYDWIATEYSTEDWYRNLFLIKTNAQNLGISSAATQLFSSDRLLS